MPVLAPKGTPFSGIGTSKQELLAAAASTTASINEIGVTNTTGGAVVINLEMWPLGASGTPVRWWKDLPLLANQSVVFKGVRYLLATDSVQLWSDTASSLDAYVSWLPKATTAPAPTRNREWKQALTTVDTLYTGPTNKSAVNDLTICNNSGVDSDVTVELVRGATRAKIIDALTLGTAGLDAMYEHPGSINMELADTLEVTATNGVDIWLSAQES